MIRFGTGGWRDVIGDGFTKENIKRVAQGIADLMWEEGKTDKPVMIGYDRRFLSEDAARWVAEVLAANGATVWFMRRSAPTPLVMFTVKDEKLHYGVEITASHNPAAYNGIKLIVEEGRDASVECTARLEELIERATVRSIGFAEAEANGQVVWLRTPFNKFLDSILGRLDVETIRNAGIRVLFNPMHGSGTYPLMAVLYTARCTVDLMDANKDAFFGGTVPAPGLRQLGPLAGRVVRERYDLGIAVDGDGDRIGIIDSDGEYIDANKILVMLYYYLHEYRGWRGPVVRNLATTHMLDLVAQSFGEVCHEVPVGFKYISAKLDETDAVLGGESSGGLTVRGHIFGKDSISAVCGNGLRARPPAARDLGGSGRQIRHACDGRGQPDLRPRRQTPHQPFADGGKTAARVRGKNGDKGQLRGRLQGLFFGRQLCDLPFFGHRTPAPHFCRGRNVRGRAGVDRNDESFRNGITRKPRRFPRKPRISHTRYAKRTLPRKRPFCARRGKSAKTRGRFTS